MKRHTTSELREQGASTLQSLNDWRAVVVHKPETRAGRYIVSRFPVHLGHADLIAALAGLGGDR